MKLTMFNSQDIPITTTIDSIKTILIPIFNQLIMDKRPIINRCPLIIKVHLINLTLISVLHISKEINLTTHLIAISLKQIIFKSQIIQNLMIILELLFIQILSTEIQILNLLIIKIIQLIWIIEHKTIYYNKISKELLQTIYLLSMTLRSQTESQIFHRIMLHQIQLINLTLIKDLKDFMNKIITKIINLTTKAIINKVF